VRIKLKAVSKRVDEWGHTIIDFGDNGVLLIAGRVLIWVQTRPGFVFVGASVQS
jgi:hypothetical protein